METASTHPAAAARSACHGQRRTFHAHWKLANSGERRQIAEAIGLLLAIALSRFLAAQLFQVEAIDPPLYAVATMMLVGVAGLAYGVLAYRAVHVNPAAVLRGDAFPALG